MSPSILTEYFPESLIVYSEIAWLSCSIKSDGEAMQCAICKHGETAPEFAVVTLNRAESVMVFKEVPADVCQTCGEYYLTAEVSRDLLERAEAAVAAGAEVEVRRYAA
jgi:YgiT-type zinc finger domain-containing protein